MNRGAASAGPMCPITKDWPQSGGKMAGAERAGLGGEDQTRVLGPRMRGALGSIFRGMPQETAGYRVCVSRPWFL